MLDSPADRKALQGFIGLCGLPKAGQAVLAGMFARALRLTPDAAANFVAPFKPKGKK